MTTFSAMDYFFGIFFAIIFAVMACTGSTLVHTAFQQEGSPYNNVAAFLAGVLVFAVCAPIATWFALAVFMGNWEWLE